MTEGGLSTKKNTSLATLGIVALFLAVFWFSGGSPVSNTAAASGTETKVVRFLIAHEPVSVFERSNKVFKDELEKLSGGAMTFEVLTAEDFGVTGRDLTQTEVYALMDAGEVDVSSMQAASFSREVPKTDIFLMPFLFKGYDTIVDFFNSNEGEEVLGEISDETRVTALAYTFSGGFRVIMLKDPNATLEDIKGKEIAGLGNGITQEGLAVLGAKAVAVNEETTRSETAGIDGAEVSYTRFSALDRPTSMQSVVETGMSVLVTMLVADDTFFNSLTQDEQDVLMGAALAAAEVERDDSIALANQTKSDLISQGVSIQELSEQTREALREDSAGVYEAFSSSIGSSFLQAVIDMQK